MVQAITPAVDPETGGAKDVSLEVWAARAELEYFTKVRSLAMGSRQGSLVLLF